MFAGYVCGHWRPAVLALGWLTCSPLWIAPAAAQTADPLPAPIHRRFEVHRQPDGFVLWGFRASVGTRDRFALAAGMPAAAARAQMLSVRWDASHGLTDPQSREMWGRRTRYGDIVETVAVVLDPTGRYARTVVYQRQPAFYSRAGLQRYLSAAFGPGQAMVANDDRLLLTYPPRGGVALQVEATRLPTRQTHWRLIHRMDAATPAPQE